VVTAVSRRTRRAYIRRVRSIDHARHKLDTLILDRLEHLFWLEALLAQGPQAAAVGCSPIDALAEQWDGTGAGALHPNNGVRD
jgi:hypothetical protein